ncbi:hypothetical protein OIU78_024149 [Salix suchowensis]|nr:hypothetical protein OIU78_024149 [Salix suchowensis]
MFSREFLRKSSQLARRVPANQRTCARTLFKQSEGSDSLPVAVSLSRSSFGGSNNGDHKSGDALLKFLLRSVASGVVIIGSSLSFSYWYPSLVDKCSFVSFADSADDAAWVSTDDLLPHKKKKRFLFGDSYRRRVFFNYEKRIRLQSPPEKSFLCSTFRYIFFVTLLSIPESSFSVAFKMFDLDNNGQIDREEFKKVMGLMRAQNRQGASHRDGRRFGLKVAEPVENGGLLEYFFGKDGKTCLQHERFVQFLRDLHDEILRLEFAHYDYRSCGTISAKDITISLNRV